MVADRSCGVVASVASSLTGRTVATGFGTPSPFGQNQRSMFVFQQSPNASLKLQQKLMRAALLIIDSYALSSEHATFFAGRASTSARMHL